MSKLAMINKIAYKNSATETKHTDDEAENSDNPSCDAESLLFSAIRKAYV